MCVLGPALFFVSVLAPSEPKLLLAALQTCLAPCVVPEMKANNQNSTIKVACFTATFNIQRSAP